MKKNDILPFTTTWVDLEGIMLTEIRDKDKYCMLPLTCGVKKKKNRLVSVIGKTRTHRERASGYHGEKEGGRGNIGVGD